MAKTAIVTDSNAGITQAEAKKLGIFVVPMPFMIGGKTYYEDINLSRDKFFKKMAKDEQILTSQPAPTEVLKIWDKALKDYEEVVHIPMSSGLSGSCQSAMMLASDYEGKVQVVNNQRISVTQKRSCLDALQMAEYGMNAREIKGILEKTKFDASIYITLETLQYLKKGGRITPAAAAIGSLLKIKPVLQIKGEKLDAFSKARTMAQAKTSMINAMRNDIEQLYGGLDREDIWLYAVDAQYPEGIEIFKKEVETAFPNFHVEEDHLSLSVCCHIGPEALAIACSKKLDIPSIAEEVIASRSDFQNTF
ncbi:MAG: DegV family protein [Lachnospiraceae bacterium]|nr:DegV family protein [Lachnospiraceae bacterium]